MPLNSLGALKVKTRKGPQASNLRVLFIWSSGPLGPALGAPILKVVYDGAIVVFVTSKDSELGLHTSPSRVQVPKYEAYNPNNNYDS